MLRTVDLMLLLLESTSKDDFGFDFTVYSVELYLRKCMTEVVSFKI